MEVAQSALCDRMVFRRPEYWSGWPFLSPGDLPTQGSNPGLPHCGQMLSCGATGKPKNTGVGSLSLLQRIFLTQESNRDLSPAFQADSLPAELSGKSLIKYLMGEKAGHKPLRRGSPCGSVVKNPGDPGSIPGWGRSPAEGNGNPLQYSCHP